MASPATLRKQRLRKTKAQLIDELESLERRLTAVEPAHKGYASGGGEPPSSDDYLANQALFDLAKFPSENPNPVLRVTPEGGLLYANNAARALKGLLTGSKRARLPSKLVKVVTEVSRTGAVQEPEIQIGDHIYAFALAPVTGESYVNIYGRDITKGKRAEAALSESEEQIRLLLNSTAEAIYGINTDGECTFCNPTCVAMLGYDDAEDLLGRHMHDLIHHTRPDGAAYPSEACLIYQAFRKGEGTHVDDEVLWRKDGTSFAAEYWSFPIKRDDRVIGAVVTFLNITERKRTEQALRESEERYALAMHGSNEGLWDWDLRENKIYISPHIRELLGLPAEQLEVTPAEWESRIHPDDLEGHLRAERAHLDGETEFYDCEYRVCGHDGVYRWVRDRGLGLRDEAGEVYRKAGSLGDITERKRAEGEIRKSREQLQALADNLPEFISMKDSDERFIFVNKQFEEWVCQSRDDVIGKTVFDTYKDDQAIEFHALDRQVIDSREVLSEEVELTYPDGKTRVVIRTRFPVISSNGEMLGVGTVNHDITERRRAEEAVRESEQRLTDSIEALPDGFALHDADDRLVVYNSRYAELLFPGIADAPKPGTQWEANLRAQCAHGFIPAAEGRLEAWIAERRAAHLNPKDPIVQERNGNTWIRLSERKAQDGGIVTIVTDITELKRAEQELARKEAQLRVALDNMPGGMTVEDRDRNYVLFNTKYCELHDYPEGFLKVGMSAREEVRFQAERGDFGPGDTDELVEQVLSLDEGGVTASWERTFPNGRTLRFNTAPMPEGGNAQIVTDITERKRAEEALREKTEFLQLTEVITRAANEAASVEAAIEMALDQVCRHTGWPVGHAYLVDESTAELTPSGIWHLDDAKAFGMFRNVSAATRFASGVGLPGRVLATREPAWIVDVTRDENFPRAKLARDIGVKAGVAFPVMVGKDVVAVLEFFSDQVAEPYEPLLEVMVQIGTQLGRVVERARAEELLVAAKEEALAATQMKSRFLANISHELRTPMNAIIGFTRLVMRRSKDRLEAKQYGNLEKVLSSAQNLLLLINDILDLSKIEAGQITIHPTEFALDSVIEDCLRTVEPVVKRDRVRVVQEVEIDLPKIFSDEDKVRQILINLLSNAAKFTEEGSIATRARCHDEMLVIEVADTGIGIPEDAQELIFEEFGQTQDGTVRRHSGTGLGLAITRNLAQLLGGDITVESTPGVGSTFTVAILQRYVAGNGQDSRRDGV